MTQATITFVLVGCLLGAVQLVIGIAVGMWLRRGEGSADHSDRQDMLHAGRIAKRLQELAGEVSSSVGEHQHRLEAASELLSEPAGDDESIAELVVDVIGGIVRANHNLQSKLETAEHRLQEQALEIEAHISRSLTDSLTGLPNRREFDARLEERMAGWNRRGEIFSLLMLDVDHFKRLNDLLGHQAGDFVLTNLGGILRSALRRDDVLARYGGEEFAIILPGAALDNASLVVPKVCDVVRQTTLNHAGQRINISLSGGLATIRPGETSESLIARADEALYAAKSAGRNRAYWHDGTACRPLDEPTDAQPASSHAPQDEFNAAGSGDEIISPELARACEELRQFVQQHGEEFAEPAAAH